MLLRVYWGRMKFLVYRWSLPSESTKTIAPTDQTLTPFFKPIATPIATNTPPMTTSLPGIAQKPAPAPVTELDSRPAETTSTNKPPIAPNALPSNNPLVCSQCGMGPFDNQLKLQSHKATAHPLKKARRKKTMPDLTASTAPIPTASTNRGTSTHSMVPSAVLEEPYYIPSTTPSRSPLQMFRHNPILLQTASNNDEGPQLEPNLPDPE